MGSRRTEINGQRRLPVVLDSKGGGHLTPEELAFIAALRR